MRNNPRRCAWCGKEMADNPSGRKRKYCDQSCRQRAYEQRKLLEGTAIPADSLILSAEKAEMLHDQLFELRCAAEDISTAVAEGEDRSGVQTLTEELVTLAREIETFRGEH